ncbi:unnamed protein product [Notodromas monacha]|uniref:Uncharacterized protein n=1 Tax=Notodromas monacha TaxID=399045 RepID=A0A7R9BFV2_9CRUS|nr:unnamed protein product [Notodromas monacha]CAG0914683.1 unnamed protein product [Notodromas monacha]
MSAYLVRLDFGLRDLSYMKLERIGSTDHGPRKCGMTHSRAEFYVEWHEHRHNTADPKRIPLHVHKVENGIKVGALCPKQYWLEKLFSVGEALNGEFVLTVERVSLHLFNAELQVRKLYTGEIGYPHYSMDHYLHQVFKCTNWKNLKVLEINSSYSSKYTSPKGIQQMAQLEKLSIRCPHLGNIFVDVARDEKLVFYQLQRVTLACSLRKFSSLDLNCVFPRLKSLCLEDSDREFSHFRRNPQHPPLSSITFINSLGSGVLSSLSAEDFPARVNQEAWLLAQQVGTFANLESLAVGGKAFSEVPRFHETNFIFPKLKFLWLKDVSAMKASHMLPLMTCLEMVWIQTNRPNQFTERAIRDQFNKSSKKWLENLKFISADYCESCIPYSSMTKLECVALVCRSDARAEYLGRILEELRSCHKLRGLILYVSSDEECRTLGRLFKKQLEFAAVSGSKLDCLISLLKFLARDQKLLEELWILVKSSEDFGDIFQTLSAFKQLEKVIFVAGPNFWRIQDEAMMPTERLFQEALWKYLDPVCSLERATLLFRSSNGYSSVTYCVERKKLVTFSSSVFLKFFSDWLDDVPMTSSEERTYRAGAFDFLLHIF